MSFSPSTPSKKRDNPNSTIIGLNIQWGFELPVRNAPTSPSKKSRSLESKIVTKITYLHYRNRLALIQALDNFNKYALSVFSKWVFKPHADLDTLPLSGIRKAPVFPLERELTAEEIALMLETLLRFLEAESTRETRDQDALRPLQPQKTGLSEADSTNLSYDAGSEMSSTNHSSRPGKAPRPFERDASPMRLVPKPEPPESSENFGSWNDTHDQLMMELVDSNSGTPNEDTEDEEFGTPPEEPCQLIDDRTSKGNSLFRSQTEQVPMGSPTSANKKRPSAGNEGIETVSKKALRGDSIASALSYPVTHHHPVVNNDTPLKTPSRTTSASTSFTSVTTSASSYRSNQPDTAQTSFDSSIQVVRKGPEAIRTPASNEKVRRALSDISLEGGKAAVNKDFEQVGKIPDVVMRSVSRLVPDAQLSQESDLEEYFNRNLRGQIGPFSDPPNHFHGKFSFQVLYEVTRVALHARCPANDLFKEVSWRSWDDLGGLYAVLSNYLQRQSQRLPARCSKDAWKLASESFDRASFTGDLLFSDSSSKPMFELQPKPLKIDKSHRLVRKYGAERFMTIGLPGLEPKALPDYLKGFSEQVKSAIVDWLIDGTHKFLGRTWKAFYIKKQEATTKTKREKRGSLNSIAHQVYFFATDGPGFVSFGALGKGLPVTTPISDLLKWFMPFKGNKEQPLLKLFARLQLAVSSTASTIEFEKWQILRCDDIYSDSNHGPKRLNVVKSNSKKIGEPQPHRSHNAEVMTDGCARISYQAAQYVAQKLGLDYVPSAFQGRIAGAKGMWMVDYTNEVHPTKDRPAIDLPNSKDDPSVWIEITDSQLKFNSPETAEAGWPDPLRKTFEVNAYSKPLMSASLNFQLMAILTEQGVPRGVFEKLLREDLTTKTSLLKVAMEDPVALRVWNQENSPVSGRRVQSNGIAWLGGFPDDSCEQINCLIEHGFSPKECERLNRLCFEEIKKYSERLSDRMHIGLGRSTYAFMLADPLGVLNENEIHFGFSTGFKDVKSDFYDTMLDGMDVLVARLPASLSSDVQKVRATFKPELSRYKDVIMFPTRGNMSLATKLSGGDYDGDRAWVCWEPSIVENFRNSEPPEKPPFQIYNISKDQTKVAELIPGSGSELEVAQFLKFGFEFALRPSLLGIVTNYHESFVYELYKKKRPECVNDPSAIKIGQLLGYLVDAAKGGFIFGYEQWKQYQKSNGLPAQLKRPAFMKHSSSAEPNLNHVVDYLAFEVTKKVIREELKGFMDTYKDKRTPWDPDLSFIWGEEEKLANESYKSNPGLLNLLKNLKEQLDSLHSFYRESTGSTVNDSSLVYRMRIEELRSRFLEIKPLAIEGEAGLRWNSTFVTTMPWDLLKASALFTRFHKYGNFVWSACGKELCEIKVMKTNLLFNLVPDKGGMRMVIKSIHDIFRPDGKMVQKLREKALASTEDNAFHYNDDEDDGDYGGVSSDEFYDVMSDMGYF